MKDRRRRAPSGAAPDAILSFGQGCEGEPLLQARRIEQAIRAIRARTARGTLNINTNASNPRALQRLYDAGLDSLRASTISAVPETYNAYYRPIGYTLRMSSARCSWPAMRRVQFHQLALSLGWPMLKTR